MKVSIIIPVYNMEKYLKKCLDSAVSQTLKEVEIIIVNDGSSDGSIDIIREYKLKYDNIVVIDQSNQGLSAARNAGIEVARGMYIAFADSDDYFSRFFLEKMFIAAERTNSDIAICSFKRVYKNEKVSIKKCTNKCKILNIKNATKELLIDIKMKNYVWNKIYKRELFINNDIRFPLGASYEDLATTYKLFSYSEKIVQIEDILYFYLQRRSSITRTFNNKDIQYILKALSEMKTFFIKENVFQYYKMHFKFLCYKNLIFLIYKVIKYEGLSMNKIKKLVHSFNLLTK